MWPEHPTSQSFTFLGLQDKWSTRTPVRQGSISTCWIYYQGNHFKELRPCSHLGAGVSRRPPGLRHCGERGWQDVLGKGTGCRLIIMCRMRVDRTFALKFGKLLLFMTLFYDDIFTYPLRRFYIPRQLPGVHSTEFISFSVSKQGSTFLIWASTCLQVGGQRVPATAGCNAGSGESRQTQSFGETEMPNSTQKIQSKWNNCIVKR